MSRADVLERSAARRAARLTLAATRPAPRGRSEKLAAAKREGSRRVPSGLTDAQPQNKRYHERMQDPAYRERRRAYQQARRQQLREAGKKVS